MLTKNQVQYFRSLKRRKFRQKYNKFPAEGDKIVREVLQCKPEKIRALAALPAWLEGAPPEVQKGNFEVYTLSEKELQQLSSMATPNQVIAYLEYWECDWTPERCRQGLSFYLDGLQDPGNVGTLLRIADWFGMPYVFGSPDSADFFHPKVIQSSMGAFLRVEHRRLDLDAILARVGSLPVLGASMDGKSVFEGTWPDAGIIVLGREGSGIRESLAGQLTEKVSIPGKGGAESLNAAVAGGILAAQLTFGSAKE